MVRSGGVSRLRLTVVRGTVYSADRVFVRTEGGVSMSTLRFITVGETVYSASRVYVGSKSVSRLRLRSPTSSTKEERLVSSSKHYRAGRSFVSLWSFWTALDTTQVMVLGGCPPLGEDTGCDGERIRSVLLLVM